MLRAGRRNVAASKARPTRHWNGPILSSNSCVLSAGTEAAERCRDSVRTRPWLDEAAAVAVAGVQGMHWPSILASWPPASTTATSDHSGFLCEGLGTMAGFPNGNDLCPRPSRDYPGSFIRRSCDNTQQNKTKQTRANSLHNKTSHTSRGGRPLGGTSAPPSRRRTAPLFRHFPTSYSLPESRG